MRITVDDYTTVAHLHRLAEQLIERFGLDRNSIVEMRVAEGVVEYDWVWLAGPPDQYGVVRTTRIEAVTPG